MHIHTHKKKEANMPNTPVWGNSDSSRHSDQDLISALGSGSVIKVNDVNDDDDDKKAIHAINNSEKLLQSQQV